MTENEAIIREKISDFEMHYAEFDKYPQNIESDFVEAVSSLLQEIQQYRAIGTVEELQALKEKNEPKKVVRQKGLLNEYYHEEECPNCKAEFRVHVAGYRYTQVVGETHYCPNCGQKLDWQ